MRASYSTTLLFCGLSIIARAGALDSCKPPNFPLPQFKTASFNVRDFGATGDGKANDTVAINRAIEKCTASGGGDVVFPAGTYLAASIHLQSNVRFLLDKNAVITGARDGYDPPEANQFEKYQDFGHSHFHNALMWGQNIENFAIVGGRINGGDIVEGDDLQGRDIGDKVIAIKSSRNLLFDGVMHESGGHFVYLLNDCENVTLSSIVIKKSRDAVNLVSCRNVQMHDCNFTGCGDDTVALKSDYALGRKIVSANIYVWNCYLESASNAVVVGAETVGDFQNLNFWDIRVGRAWKAGIAIHSMDGAIVDGATYRNISMQSVDVPVSIMVRKRLLSGEPNRKVGAIRNVAISSLTSEKPRPRKAAVVKPSVIAGLPESIIENVLLERTRIASKGGPVKQERSSGEATQKSRPGRTAIEAAGLYISWARAVNLRDVSISYETQDQRPSLVANNVSELRLENCNLQRFTGVPLLRFRNIDDLVVRHSASLSDREADHVEAAEE